MRRITHIVIEEDGSGTMSLETDEPDSKTAEYPITAEQVELFADFMQAVWRDAGGVQV